MAGMLGCRADYTGQFAAEVSHVFKAPLVERRRALDPLQDHAAGMSEAERLGCLAQSIADVDRLAGRLLELARAKAPRPASGEQAARARGGGHGRPEAGGRNGA